jgi:hypothetical protein
MHRFAPTNNWATVSRLFAAFAALFFSATILLADPPGVAYIFPAGGQQGTTTKFKVGGYNLHESAPFEMLGPGVEASSHIERTETFWLEGPVIPLPASQKAEDYPKDYLGQVKIAADAPLGVRPWRVWTSQGATSAVLKFVVGDLPEIVEQETDGEPLPVKVQLPVTINGRIFPREDVDLWSFQAKKGETIRAEVWAARLGTPLDARLEVLSPRGVQVAEATAGADSDPALHFTAPEDGTYQVKIHDVAFEGLQSFVYRLTLSALPHVDRAYPLGGRRGETVRLELAGQGLATQSSEVKLPADGKSGPGWYSHRLDVRGRATDPFLLELDNLPEVLEAEPNDAADKIAAVTLPVVLNGRIGKPGDVDCWSASLKKGDAIDFDLRASRLGSPLDGVLIVSDATGKEVARADDMPGGQTDAQFRFTAPADGDYVLQVSERFASRGGPDFAYRLRVTPPPENDFRLTLVGDARTPGPDVVTLVRSSATPAEATPTTGRAKPPATQVKVKLVAERLGKFEGAINLSVEGLPAGVTVQGTEIAAKKPGTDLTFQAEPTAAIQAKYLTIRGTAEIDGRTVTRTATVQFFPTPALPVPTVLGQEPFDKVLLTVALPTPFKILPNYDFSFTARGTVYRKRYQIDRGGFEGPLEVSMADRQGRHLQGVYGPKVIVPAGVSEVEYPLTLPPWMEVGRTSRAILMVVATMVEPDGSRHRVNFSSNDQDLQLIARIGPGPVDLDGEQTSLAVYPNSMAEAAFRVTRDPSLAGKLTLELIVPPHVADVSAEAVTIPADTTAGVLRIKCGQNPGPLNMPLVVRATLVHPTTGDAVVAETKLELVPRR